MNETPDFYVFWLPLLVPLFLVVTVYRLTRLVTKDDFPPVLWVRDRLAGGWRPLTDKEREVYAASREKGQLIQQWEIDKTDITQRYVRRAPWSPHWLAELMTCPWCASGWLSGAVVGLTDVTYGLPVPWLMGFFVWGVSALLASQEWA